MRSRASHSQGDLGGQRTLQKKWTSFLKAKLVCSMPELNFVFNVVHDVFILKGADWRDTVIYGVFTSQWSVILKIWCKIKKKEENFSSFIYFFFLSCFSPFFFWLHHPSLHLRGNVGLSAVCAYNLTAVEDVFSRGKYMQKATVEQSHTKWVRYNGITPSPRPGAVSGHGKA